MWSPPRSTPRPPERFASAWPRPGAVKDRDLDQVCDTIVAIKRVVTETCVTLGMLTPKQAARLVDVGPDFYNHNMDVA
ncbi:biotin synthase-like enzyme [Bradyrhizobium sp. i1.15.2]